MTQDGIIFSLATSCLRSLFKAVDDAWFQQVVLWEVSHRKGMKDLKCPDLQSTSLVFRSLSDTEQRIMAKYLSAGWTLNDRAKHWKPNDGRCEYCGEQDGNFHRHFECEFFKDVRTNHQTTIDWVQDQQKEWADLPFVPQHHDAVRWKQLCSLPMTMHTGDKIFDNEEHFTRFFTDGTSYSNILGPATVSYWGIVLDTTTSETERKCIAADYKLNKKIPNSMVQIQAGRVQGCQGIDRAELCAVIATLKLASRPWILSDSQYALDLLSAVLSGLPLEHFHRMTNFDLIVLLFDAVQGRTPDMIKMSKVSSHQNLDTIVDCVQLYDAIGNSVVDSFVKKQWTDCEDPSVRQMITNIAHHVEETRQFFKAYFPL